MKTTLLGKTGTVMIDGETRAAKCIEVDVSLVMLEVAEENKRRHVMVGRDKFHPDPVTDGAIRELFGTLATAAKQSFGAWGEAAGGDDRKLERRIKKINKELISLKVDLADIIDQSERKQIGAEAPAPPESNEKLTNPRP